MGIASTPSGNGYWLVGGDGGVYAFGDAGSYGSLPGSGISRANVTAIAGTADGGGYWIATSAGEIYSYGNAAYGGAPAGENITGIARSGNTNGYWLVSASGGIFSYNGAPFKGSLPSNGVTPNGAVRGITSAIDGNGYWLISQDGGVFSFGSAEYVGNPTPTPKPSPTPTPKPSPTPTKTTTTNNTTTSSGTAIPVQVKSPDGQNTNLGQNLPDGCTTGDIKPGTNCNQYSKYSLPVTAAPATNAANAITGNDCRHIALSQGVNNIPCVKKLQSILKINADGKFGSQTGAAVSKYRTAKGVPDCTWQNVDHVLWGFLLNDISSKPPGCAKSTGDIGPPTKYHKHEYDKRTFPKNMLNIASVACVSVVPKNGGQTALSKVWLKVEGSRTTYLVPLSVKNGNWKVGCIYTTDSETTLEAYVKDHWVNVYKPESLSGIEVHGEKEW